ncbi:hypothetical protein [Radiobacillus sp. PE A8.2]|uniref:hypothetical protein n=1 Tax=Radiobacillus sp. PE A8.2 TaxID=3380349 RepID=UPI00389059B1
MTTTINDLKIIFENALATYKNTITELSKDTDNNESLCISNKQYIDYDKLVETFYHSDETLSSPDLIYVSDEKIVYVEFKNGSLKKSMEKKTLKLKGIEGGFIALFNIFKSYKNDVTFDEIQLLKKEYYVVYNSEKNPHSSSRVAGIVSHLQMQPIRFGLKWYQGNFFSKVETMSSHRFLERIDDLLK